MVQGQRRRYSAILHEELNTTVNGFITKSRSIHDVVAELNRSKEFVGKSEGLTPGSVDNAVTTIKDIVTFRLQEAATDAILVGKRKGQSQELLKRFETSLKEAEVSGYLKNDVDLRDFKQLLQNLQAKLLGELGQVADRVPWLVGELDRLEALSDQSRLTDATLALLTHALLKELRKDEKAADKLVEAGGLDIIAKILLGDPEAKIDLPLPFHPELQAGLAQVLAQVVLACRRKLHEKKSQRKHALNFYPDKKPADDVFNARMGQLAQQTMHGATSKRAIDTLFAALDGAVKRNEHALVWGVLSSLSPLVKDGSCCQQMLMVGFLPLFYKILESYGASKGRLPNAVERPHGRGKMFSKTPPSFHAIQRPSAIDKKCDTVKETWLRTSESLPELSSSSKQRNSLEWLASSSSHGEGGFGRTKRGLRPAPLDTVSPQGTADATLQPSMSSTFPRDKMRSQEFLQSQPLPQISSPNGDFPSLMWLLGEDGVPSDAFNRVCDRNFVILKVKRLLQHMETARSDLAGILRRAPRIGLQEEAKPPSRGGRSTASKRPPSRGQLSHEQLHQSMQQTQDEMHLHHQKELQKEQRLMQTETLRKDQTMQEVQQLVQQSQSQ